jgi:DNA-binding NarL/FixJ family response regulator
VEKARILLGDDHPLFLEGGQGLLREQYEVVGAASDGRALVEAALRLKPGLILLDISMPLLSGIEAARRIKASLPAVKILFFTMHHERPYVQAAFEAGAAGYLLKSATSQELLYAIQEIQKGRLYFSSQLSEHGIFLQDLGQIAQSFRLSLREQEVLRLIAEGRSSKEMADILNISVKTISFHRENVKQKLGLKTIAELTRHAIANGLV